jgi:hypothetical protein
LQVAALIPSLFAQFNAGLTQAARHAVIAARSYKQLVDDNPEVELTLHPKEETICRKEIEKSSLLLFSNFISKSLHFTFPNVIS